MELERVFNERWVYYVDKLLTVEASNFVPDAFIQASCVVGGAVENALKVRGCASLRAYFIEIRHPEPYTRYHRFLPKFTPLFKYHISLYLRAFSERIVIVQLTLDQGQYRY